MNTVRTATRRRPAGELTEVGSPATCSSQIDQEALENQLAVLLDAPVPGPIPLAPTLDLSGAAGASWLNLLRLVAAESARGDGRFWPHRARSAGSWNSCVPSRRGPTRSRSWPASPASALGHCS